MISDREKLLSALMESYSVYYDIFPAAEDMELPLSFRADYYSRNEKYMLIKEAKIWAAETNEHVYVFSAPAFDAETARRCIDFVLEDGLPRVKPHNEHMYTYLIAQFIADDISPDVAKLVRKSRYYKNYKLSLHGFSALKTATLDLNKEMIVTNRIGHDLAKFLKEFIKKFKENVKRSETL